MSDVRLHLRLGLCLRLIVASTLVAQSLPLLLCLRLWSRISSGCGLLPSVDCCFDSRGTIVFSGLCVWFDATIQMVGQSRVSGTARGYLGSALRGQDAPFYLGCFEFLGVVGTWPM